MAMRRDPLVRPLLLQEERVPFLCIKVPTSFRSCRWLFTKIIRWLWTELTRRTCSGSRFQGFVILQTYPPLPSNSIHRRTTQFSNMFEYDFMTWRMVLLVFSGMFDRIDKRKLILNEIKRQSSGIDPYKTGVVPCCHYHGHILVP